VQTLFSALHHQYPLLVILLDTFMRRGLLSPSAIIDVLVDTSSNSLIFGELHLNHLHSNQWVWKLIEISSDRCLDIMKAAVSIQNNEAHKQLLAHRQEHQQQQQQQQEETTDMEIGASSSSSCEIQIPEAILEAVEAAAETCRELYSSLVSQLLCLLHQRHQMLVSNGQESSQSLQTGKLSSLDPRLVSYVSTLTRILRNFHLVETGLRVGCVAGTAIPLLTSSAQVSTRVLAILGSNVVSGDEHEGVVIQQAIESLAGPARRIWQSNSTL
jgi:hypothetical protein